MANPFLVNGTGSPQSIYQVRTSPEHKIGERGIMDDGRVFYYSSNTTSNALAVGKLYVKQTLIPEHHEADVTAGAAGSYTITGITIGAVAITANQYQDGYCAVTDGAGEGHCYKIKEHAAFLASATTVAVTLYDPIAVALDTNSTVSLMANNYVNPMVSVADQLDIPVGVLPVGVGAGNTTPKYFWMQTWGEAAVLQDEAVAALGQALTIGSSVVGALEEDDTATTVSQEFICAWGTTASVDTEYSGVYLTIRP